LLSGKNIFKIEILSLPVRSGGASFHFAQNDNELSMQKLLVGAGLAALPPTQHLPTANAMKTLSFRGFTQKINFSHNEVMTGSHLLLLLFDLHSLAVLCIVFSNLFPSLVPKVRGIMSGTFFTEMSV